MQFILFALCCILVSPLALAAEPGRFTDPLDMPAVRSQQPTLAPLIAITRAGARLVAVGSRGLIITSDDAGKSWRQASVPVSSDLVAVQFPTPQQGWATGHDGVVLHTADGGATWVKQLDGRQLSKSMVAHFAAPAAQGDAVAARLLPEVQRNFANGPEQPILGVWFESELVGYITSSFGMMLATHDGGRTWESWMERVDNPQLLHLNAIVGVAGQVYIASEQGTVFRLDRAKRRFVALKTGYAGSFFGVVGTRAELLVHGLRGTVYRSFDAGDTWQQVETGLQAGLTAAVVLDTGRVLLATQDGRVVVHDAVSRSFRSLKVLHPTLFAGAVQAGASVVLVGLGGVRSAPL